MRDKKDYNRRYYTANKLEIAKVSKEYYKRNRAAILDKKRLYRKTHQETIRATNKKQYDKNQSARVDYSKNYYRNNRDKIYAYRKLPNSKAKRQAYLKQRRETDENFRLRHYLRQRICLAVKRQKGRKSDPFYKLLGCDVPFLKGFLEARFQPGMSWENYGPYGWHIDHHIPCAEFDLRDPQQQRLCFHYSNLKPLWAAKNIGKSDNLPEPHQAELI